MQILVHWYIHTFTYAHTTCSHTHTLFLLLSHNKSFLFFITAKWWARKERRWKVLRGSLRTGWWISGRVSSSQNRRNEKIIRKYVRHYSELVYFSVKRMLIAESAFVFLPCLASSAVGFIFCLQYVQRFSCKMMVYS